jgi:hypothetical protein
VSFELWSSWFLGGEWVRERRRAAAHTDEEEGKGFRRLGQWDHGRCAAEAEAARKHYSATPGSNHVSTNATTLFCVFSSGHVAHVVPVPTNRRTKTNCRMARFFSICCFDLSTTPTGSLWSKPFWNEWRHRNDDRKMPKSDWKELRSDHRVWTRRVAIVYGGESGRRARCRFSGCNITKSFPAATLRRAFHRNVLFCIHGVRTSS